MASQSQSDYEQPFEDHHKLGRYVSHHPSRRFVLLLRGGFLYAVPTLLLNNLFINDDSELIALVLPIVFTILALAILWYIAHLWNREVVLYADGFTYREGSRMGTFLYREIAQVQAQISRESYFGLITHTLYRYTLRTELDEVLRINNLYQDIETLGTRLEAFVIRDRLQLYEGEFARGIAVRFGDHLRLSQQGIEYEGRELYWHELTGHRVKDGALALYKGDGSLWASIPVNEIDNAFLLVALLKSRKGSPGAKGVEHLPEQPDETPANS